MQLSPEQFHTLFDRAAQPVLLVQDGMITQCSSRAEGLIAPGSPIRELLPPDAVLRELIAAAPSQQGVEPAVIHKVALAVWACGHGAASLTQADERGNSPLMEDVIQGLEALFRPR